MKTILILPLLLAFLLFQTPASGQYAPVANFDYYHVENGLSHNFAHDIVQDRHGFIWIGTQYGLQRFDGQQFTTFLHSPSDSNSMASNNISFLEIEKDGKFLIGFYDSPILDRFDPVNGKFTHEKISTIATSIGRCQNGDTWLGNGSQLWRKAKVNKKTAVHSYAFHPKHSLYDGLSIEDIWVDKKQAVWTGTKRGLYKIGENGAPGDWWLPCDDQYFSTDTTFFVHDMLEDPQGRLWLATEQGLFVRSETEPCLMPFRTSENTAFPFAGQNTTSIALGPQGQLWICTESEGVYRMHLGTLEVQHIPSHTMHGNKDGLSFLEKIFVDKRGAVWLLSTDRGVHVYHPYSQQFQWFNETSALESGEPSPFLYMVLEDSKNHLWRLEDYVEFDDYPALEKMEPLSSGYAITEAPGGIFWFSSTRGSVKRIDSNTGDIQSFSEATTVNKYISGSSAVTAEYVDKKGNFWAGFWGGGAAYFDEKDLVNPKFFTCGSRTSDIALGCYVQGITESRDGKVWFATAGAGLSVFNPKDESWKVYRKGKNEDKLTHGYVRCLMEAQSGMIWLGTYGGGVFRFDPELETFTPFNRSHGLPDDLIEEIIEDKNGYIWIVGAKTIARLDPAKETIQIFDQEDGLPDTKFNRMTYAKNTSGRMFLSTNQGYVVFHPDSVQVDTVAPNTAIVKMSRYNSESDDGKPIEVKGMAEEESVELSYQDYIVTFEFAAITFQKAAKTTLEYKLEGFQNEWIRLENSRQVSFTSLPSGNYTLLVRSANADGFWDKTPAKLKIKMNPPWWKTWWAYLGYFLLAGGTIWYFWKKETRRLKLQNQLEKEQLEAAQLRELDETKTRFFANLSHEFRTPLTVILGMAEEIEKPGMAKSLIRQSGQNLLRLVNQMLDFNKLEGGKLKLNLQSGDLVRYLQYILESFHSLAEHKNIELEFASASSELEMDFDEEKIQHIVSNLLSNAIKFTHRDGKVSLSIFEKNGRAHIQVKDTGIGIAPDQLPHIFERFFQVGNPMSKGEPGTGIGLAFSKELVELMDGTIEVKSEEGVGSVFTVLLPLANSFELGVSSFESKTLVNSPPIKESTNQGKGQSTQNSPDSYRDETQNSLLVIEDNPEVVAYIRTVLENEYDITVAENGQIGIEKAVELIPDIIISDVMMPVKDGFAVTRFLKNDERTSHIPIVLLTAKADVESRLEGLGRGADAYLAKPFDKKELKLRLEKLIELREKLQARYAQFILPEKTAPDEDIQIEDAFLQKSTTSSKLILTKRSLGWSSCAEKWG